VVELSPALEMYVSEKQASTLQAVSVFQELKVFLAEFLQDPMT
jgi:hypothetical protein